MEFDKAVAADVPAIAALWHEGWHQGHAAIAPAALVRTRDLPEFLARTKAHLPQTTVLRGENGIVGFHMIEDDEIYQFYVDAAFRGQGVAARLMAHAEKALAGRRAWLACSVGNDRAAGFYAKAGWSNAGEVVYPVETASGPQDVTVWRFEKDLT